MFCQNHCVMHVLCQVSMAEPKRSPFSMARGKDESSEEEETPSRGASPTDRKASGHRRRRSHAEGHRKSRREDRDPSHSYVQRRHRRRHRREHGHERRRRRSHGSPVPDKRRRSASAPKEEKSAGKGRPPSPVGKPPKANTKPCPHCWQEVTTHPSGRAQHQWSSRSCLEWQFYNEISAAEKKEDDQAAWAKAKRAAALCHNSRQYMSAPRADPEPMPPPPSPAVHLKSRSRVRASARHEDDMEEIPEEPVEPPRPTRSATATRSTGSKPAAQAVVPAAVPSGTGPSGSNSEAAVSASKTQQIVINITSAS